MTHATRTGAHSDHLTRSSPLAAALALEAVQQIEAAGPLDDAHELRQALGEAPTRAGQVQVRAWLLGQRLGLPQELARWRHVGRWILLGLTVVVALTGLVAGRSVLASDRSVNAMGALVGLLGLNFLALAVWLAGLVMARSGGRTIGDFSFGRLVLGLAARLPVDRGPHALTLLRAARVVMRRQRLWPWLTGMLSHVVWIGVLALTFVVLFLGFAFQSYQLSWETTILSTGFFEAVVRATSGPLAALGIPVPDASAVRQAGQTGILLDASVQRQWAWWLMGCVLVYGLLLRLLLLAFSIWRWRAGMDQLTGIDLGDPYIQAVVRRLDAMEPASSVLDRENPEAGPSPAAPTPAAPAAPGSLAVVGFELPPEWPWPVSGLPVGTQPPQRIAGGASERQVLLAGLAQTRPQALLLLVHAPSSPDRGTARFVREAAAAATKVALLPLGEGDIGRWRDWLGSAKLAGVVLLESASAASDWVPSEERASDA